MHRPRTNETSTFPVVITDLPTEILFDILLRLPVHSLICLRCVSKDMLNIVNSPVFVTLHTQRLLTNSLPTSISHIDAPRDVPQFIHFDTNGLQLVRYTHTNALHDVPQLIRYGTNGLPKERYDGNAFTRGEHPIVSKVQIAPLNHWSCELEFVFCDLFCFQYYQRREDGWSRIIRYDNPCLLVNPLRGEVLRLPTATNAQVPACPKEDVFDRLAMGLDKVTNDLKIVRVTGSAYHNMVAQVHVLGTSSWREIRSVPPCDLNSSKKVMAYGDIHWLVFAHNSTGNSSTNGELSGWTINISSFDFHKEEFYFTPPPTPVQKECLWVNSPIGVRRSNLDVFLSDIHLVNLRGAMAMVLTRVRKANSNIEIWTMKNYDEKEWTLDYKIDTTVYTFMAHHPFYSDCRLKCWEWEQGIFFSDANENVIRPPTVLVDLRSLSMTIVNFFPSSSKDAFVMSCHGSLISLGSYGDLVKANPNGERIISSSPRGDNFVYDKQRI